MNLSAKNLIFKIPMLVGLTKKEVPILEESTGVMMKTRGFQITEKSQRG